VHTIDELRHVAALADRHGVRVIADEIHAPLVLSGATFVPYLSIAGRDRRVLAAVGVEGMEPRRTEGRRARRRSRRRYRLGANAGGREPRAEPRCSARTHRRADARRRLARRAARRARPQAQPTGRPSGRASARDCHGFARRRRISRGSTAGDWSRAGLVGTDLQGPPSRATSRPSRVRPGSSLSAPTSLSAPGRRSGPAAQGHVRLNYATSADILTQAVQAMGAAERAPRRLSRDTDRCGLFQLAGAEAAAPVDLDAHPPSYRERCPPPSHTPRAATRSNRTTLALDV
jgi:cystathionine beta-lyase